MRLNDGKRSRQLILVADQDNRLHREIAINEPNLSGTILTVRDMIAHLEFDMKVLSASANNEGWERRGWGHEIEQDIDRVPAHLAGELFKDAAANEALRRLVESKYSGYPLFWGRAQAAAALGAAVGEDAVCPEKRCAVALGKFEGMVAEFMSEKIASMERLWDNAKLKRQVQFASMLLVANKPIETKEIMTRRDLFYDKNMLQCVVDGSVVHLTPICTEALSRLQSEFKVPFLSLCQQLNHSGFKDSTKFEVLWLTHVLTALVIVPLTSGQPHENPSTCLSGLVASDLDLSHVEAPTRSATRHVFLPPRHCPMYDAIVVSVPPPTDSAKRIELVVFQVTMNATHRDSCREFCTRLGRYDATPLDEWVEVVGRRFPEQASRGVDVWFMWVSNHKALAFSNPLDPTKAATPPQDSEAAKGSEEEMLPRGHQEAMQSQKTPTILDCSGGSTKNAPQGQAIVPQPNKLCMERIRANGGFMKALHNRTKKSSLRFYGQRVAVSSAPVAAGGGTLPDADIQAAGSTHTTPNGTAVFFGEGLVRVSLDSLYFEYIDYTAGAAGTTPEQKPRKTKSKKR